MFIEFQNKLIRIDHIMMVEIEILQKYSNENEIECTIYIHMKGESPNSIYTENFGTEEELNIRYYELKRLLGVIS